MPSARGIRAGAAYVELYANDSKLVRGLRSAQRRLRAFSAATREIGVGMLKLSAVFAAPFVAGVKVFADFEQQMANVSTMLEDPTMHMETFRREIRRMSVEFGESTETLAKGLYDILSASVPAEQALSVLAVSAKAAKAGLTDTGTAADAITTVLNSYGLAADRAADVSDLLFSVVKRGKTTFAELAPNIGKVASVASTAGLSLEELGATIAVLTRSGVKTERAMTAVAAIISTFLKPSAEGAEAARELGFELNAATLQSEGLRGVLERMASLPADALAEIFPNVEALRGILPALKNLEGFGEDIDAMRGRAGATEAAYAKMTATLAHFFAQLKQSALGVLSVIGEAIAEPVAKAAAAVRKYVGFIRKWIENNKALVVTALKVIGVIALVGAALVAVGSAGAAMAFVFGGIASIVSGVGTVIGILGSILAAILSPIGLVITGMVALAAYILYATGAGAKALKWLGEKFEILRRDASMAWQGIGDALAAGDIGLAAKILWLTLKMEWKRGIHFLNQLWIKFKEFFLTIATNAFWGSVALLTEAWAGMQIAWVETVTFLQNSWTGFTTGITRAWNATQNFLAKGWVELMGLFDEEMDVDAVKRQLDIQAEREDRRILEEAGRTLQEREERRKQRREEIDREREGTLVAIADMADQENRARRAQYAQDLQRSEDELANAREEWKAAIAEAARKRVEAEAGEEAPTAGEQPGVEVPDIVNRLKQQLGGVTSALESAAGKEIALEVAGTFNAMAARGLGAGNAADRTAKATEETAKNTKRIVQEMGQNQLAFE